MNIRESFSIAAPPNRVAAFLLDVERMSKCVPGVEEVTAIGDNEYEAILSINLGPIHAKFAGSVKIDPNQPPGTLKASASGKDRATGSQAQVEFTAVLTETADGSTTVESDSEITIRGKLGQFGTGVISSTAKAVVREFAACAGRAVEAESNATSSDGGTTGRSADQPEPVPTALTAPSIGRVLRSGIGMYLKELWTKIRAFFR